MTQSGGRFSPVRRMVVVATTLSFLVVSASAGAVLQPTPGGLPVPLLDQGRTTCADKNVELCVDAHEGDTAAIDVVADALIVPEVFQPTCRLSFKPLVKGGGDYVSFGYYNVKPDPAQPGQFLKPSQDELFGMFNLRENGLSGAQLAGREKALDLNEERAAGRYRGGQIGFFLAAAGDLQLDEQTRLFSGSFAEGRIYYTQHSLNEGSGESLTYYQVLTWQSVKFENAFYFGWEDQTASDGGDNDFDDLLFLVSGIQCSGGGDPCDTGKHGVCADGMQQCRKGVLACIQSLLPGPETCNALDDDCNGQLDEGELCPVGELCVRGRCVPRCGTGELRCPPPLVCAAPGVCVEAACARPAVPGRSGL